MKEWYPYLEKADEEEKEKVLRNLLIENIEFAFKEKNNNIEKQKVEIMADFLIDNEIANLSCFYYDADVYFRDKFSKWED